MTQETFDIDFPDPDRKRGEGDHNVKREPRTMKVVRWDRIGRSTVARPKCHTCVMEMEHGGKWKAPDPAVWIRTVGTDAVAYCYRHGVEPRKADGLDAGR